MIIEINGKRYKRKHIKENEQKQYSYNNIKLASLFMMLDVVNRDPMCSSKDESWKQRIDIIKEYELIDNKKSNLSKHKRDWVVGEFEWLYELVIE